ncbi:MAG: peptide-methionine (S)-S-oxide reductase [Psychroserpens sp.]|uniref:peptide-methionine (S)-S-oxide reductase n=1 Tax=Psychroserpens sp. TaxID=2020870 RepID=UPI003C8F2AAB
MDNTEKVGFGGGCHWCTEAIFQSLKGVVCVDQGYIASNGAFSSFSEAVIVTFNPDCVKLSLLIEIHLGTHKSTKNHSMREKYRSAIYTFSDAQHYKAQSILNYLSTLAKTHYITQILNFRAFKPSRESLLDYYYTNPKKPFCETFINPKLQWLIKAHSEILNYEKLSHFESNQTT